MALTAEIEARLHEYLNALYGPERGSACMDGLHRILSEAAQRLPARAVPIAPDQRLTENDVMLITYGDQVREPGRPPLQTLADLLATSLSGAVSAVHILPFYPYTSDDGFSVVDYTAVDPQLGDWGDIARLGADYRLMFDAVVNHVSASSAWFQAFLNGDPGAARRFIVMDPATDLRGITRPRTTPVLTPFETAQGVRHVWTTFSADQIDLDFADPDLLLEMTAILLEYVARGATFIRLDAIGYLWKEVGTRCIHLPQVHLVVQFWRAVLDAVAPDVMLITETNVPHHDNISYFGDGRNEAQLVYQFPLAPLTLNAFAQGSSRHLSGWAAGLEPPSPTTAFFNFLASHDGIGVVPATGILSSDEVAALCAQIEAHGGHVSSKNNPDGSQSPYELNCTWFDAISSPFDLAEPAARKIDRFLASQAIMLALQGVPGIYIHSLVGSQNDHAGVGATGRYRSINREKWQRADLEQRLADPRLHHGEVFRRYRALLQVRRREPAFHLNSPQRVLDLGDAVFALCRTTPDGASTLVCLHNVTSQPQTVHLPVAEAGGATMYVDLLGGEAQRDVVHGQLPVSLAPYQARWLKVHTSR